MEGFQAPSPPLADTFPSGSLEYFCHGRAGADAGNGAGHRPKIAQDWNLGSDVAALAEIRRMALHRVLGGFTPSSLAASERLLLSAKRIEERFRIYRAGDFSKNGCFDWAKLWLGKYVDTTHRRLLRRSRAHQNLR